MTKFKSTLLLFLISSVHLLAQGLRIEGQVKNLKPTPLILAQHFGGYTVPIDTALVDKEGKFVFEDATKIPEGVCRIIGVGRQPIELIVTQQRFKVVFDAKDPVSTAKFTNSLDNEVFFSYQRRGRQLYQTYLQAKQQAGITNDNEPRAKEMFNSLNEQVKFVVDSLYNAHSQLFAAKFLKSFQEPRLPVMMQNTTNTAYINSYLREHHFENSFLSDNRMLYTPNVPNRIIKFIKTLPTLSSKEIIRIIDKSIEATQPVKKNEPNQGEEMRRFVIQNWAKQYEFTAYPQYDTLYSYIVEKYVMQDPTLWDASTLQKIKEIAQIKQNLAIGNTFEPLTLTDTTDKIRSLKGITTPYTLLFFYEPGCIHCQEAAPKVREFLQKNADKLTVYAVSIGDDKVNWQNYIKTFHTQSFMNVQDTTHKTDFYKLGVINYPTLYLLDQHKRIIGRWLDVNQLDSYLIR